MVFSHKCTQHTSTGYSPYFLLFVRDPRLPVDNILGLENISQGGSVDDWVTKHYFRLENAMKNAKINFEKAAADRLKQVNKNTKEMLLYIGGKVLIRNREPRGRDQIQDVWKVVPYRIIDRIDPEGNVYSIQLVDGPGPVKNVHRRQILDMGQALDLAVESAEKEDKNSFIDDNSRDSKRDEPSYKQ